MPTKEHDFRLIAIRTATYDRLKELAKSQCRRIIDVASERLDQTAPLFKTEDTIAITNGKLVDLKRPKRKPVVKSFRITGDKAEQLFACRICRRKGFTKKGLGAHHQARHMKTTRKKSK